MFNILLHYPRPVITGVALLTLRSLEIVMVRIVELSGTMVWLADEFILITHT
jgi:hypothetical protein